jgi:hypothetical protein
MEVVNLARNMSFMLTTKQVRDRTKTVTRRLGWKNLSPGTVLNACEKCMGLEKGEKIKKICQIRVVDVRREPLRNMTQIECVKEGFPNMSVHEFVQMFRREMKCPTTQIVTRIEFEYI